MDVLVGKANGAGVARAVFSQSAPAESGLCGFG